MRLPHLRTCCRKHSSQPGPNLAQASEKETLRLALARLDGGCGEELVEASIINKEALQMQVLIAALRISGRLKIFAATAKVAGARFGAAQPRSASAFRDGIGPSGRPPLHMLARQWCCFDVEAAVLRKW